MNPGPQGYESSGIALKSVFLGGRITSYNVCYTKLLRWWSGNERKKELKELSFFEKWQHRGQQENTVVFLDSFTFASHVPMMFYTNCTAYSIVPSQDDVIYLQNKNRRVVVISEKNDSFEEVSGVDYVKVLDRNNFV